MSVLSIAAVADYCKVTSQANITLLQGTLDAAEAWEASRVGFLTSTAVTERITGGAPALVLSRQPVLTLTSVTGESAAVVTAGDLYLDTRAGTVVYNSGATFWEDYYTVVYTSGLATPLPAAAAEAVRIITVGMWTASQRGATRDAESGLDYEGQALRVLHDLRRDRLMVG